MTRLLQLLSLAGFIFLLPDTTYAQTRSKQSTQLGEFDEIVIKHKNSKNASVNVEIKDGEVFVDGKKLDQFSNPDISVFRRKITPRDGNAVNFNNFNGFGNFGFADDEESNEIIPNKAVLGVITEKKAATGVTIKTIGKGTPAEKAGLKTGDIITAIDDEKINEPEELFEKISEYKPQDKITVSYLRSGKSNKVAVTLGERKSVKSEDLGVFPGPRIFTLPPGGGNRGQGGDWFSLGDNSTKLGLQVQDTQDGEGAEVINVTPDSPAEKAGFQEEDIVIELAGKPIKSASELSKTYKENQEKTEVTAKVKRDGQVAPISIKIPKKLHRADL
ncbi:PDZ domain-containing protein [Chitinophaga silvatica]|uniref:PDZ domain-containing protein n=1 Tax=Chitinophaga silvatica TaxID=2282649 RepID=A0A3E1Y9X3_9BACT|nr:PDZ domain-containing protein [Chitinophaga silvatica]RFS22468.1 PDZ domain-containing protein [Chitinophaga silvatica]